MIAPSGPKRLSPYRTTPEPTGNHPGTIYREVVPGGGETPVGGSPAGTTWRRNQGPAAGNTHPSRHPNFDPRHGTAGRYNKGCRCPACVDAGRAKARAKYHASHGARQRKAVALLRRAIRLETEAAKLQRRVRRTLEQSAMLRLASAQLASHPQAVEAATR